MDNVWVEVLREALGSDGKKAMPAAKLRLALERIAHEKGIEFPFKEMQGRKFTEFLADFPEIIALRKRVRQDYLVAPAGEPELLADSPASESHQGRLRQDIYHALTRTKPDGKRAFYLPELDVVLWEIPEQAPPEAVAFPEVRPEVEDRRAFAEQMAEPTKTALEAVVPRQPAFLNAIKERALAKQWHHFRLRLLIDRLRVWCEGNGIAWGQKWIDGSLAERYGSSSLVHNDASANTEGIQVALAALGSLSDEDLRRISIPLDLVLKVIRARG